MPHEFDKSCRHMTILTTDSKTEPNRNPSQFAPKCLLHASQLRNSYPFVLFQHMYREHHRDACAPNLTQKPGDVHRLATSTKSKWSFHICTKDVAALPVH
jgi:hypothetical protein